MFCYDLKAARKVKAAAETVTSETKKSVAKAAKKAQPKAKRALKRMISEIEAQSTSWADETALQ